MPAIYGLLCFFLYFIFHTAFPTLFVPLYLFHQLWMCSWSGFCEMSSYETWHCQSAHSHVRLLFSCQMEKGRRAWEVPVTGYSQILRRLGLMEPNLKPNPLHRETIFQWFVCTTYNVTNGIWVVVIKVSCNLDFIFTSRRTFKVMKFNNSYT